MVIYEKSTILQTLQILAGVSDGYRKGHLLSPILEFEMSIFVAFLGTLRPKVVDFHLDTFSAAQGARWWKPPIWDCQSVATLGVKKGPKTVLSQYMLGSKLPVVPCVRGGS